MEVVLSLSFLHQKNDLGKLDVAKTVMITHHQRKKKNKQTSVTLQFSTSL